ncbi:TetR/AcrR family transcriptional regulator [Streptomyces sp. NPDC017056]|uniref:TetR/AcrR family transcriptional regulator n=1 Tax=Streptomyces sp. NPDC017056 TaxID=3364973 RepID=UPI00379D8844
MTAEDWADAALAALGEGGLAAVAVEPIATRLGTTKGSFYWHFANRDALVEAEADPERRLRGLFAYATAAAADDPLEVSLLATAADSRVAAVLRRVTERRIGYLAGLFAELGFPEAEARRRGLLAYTAYLGHAQLGHAVPQNLPGPADRDRYLDSVLDALLHRAHTGAHRTGTEAE